MFNPLIWKWVPMFFTPIDFDKIPLTLEQIEDARKYREVELMLDHDGNWWWRRDLRGDCELGL